MLSSRNSTYSQLYLLINVLLAYLTFFSLLQPFEYWPHHNRYCHRSRRRYHITRHHHHIIFVEPKLMHSSKHTCNTRKQQKRNNAKHEEITLKDKK